MAKLIRRPRQQPDRLACFGGQLQPSRGGHVQSAAVRHDRCNCTAAQRKINRPKPPRYIRRIRKKLSPDSGPRTPDSGPRPPDSGPRPPDPGPRTPDPGPLKHPQVRPDTSAQPEHLPGPAGGLSSGRCLARQVRQQAQRRRPWPIRVRCAEPLMDRT